MVANITGGPTIRVVQLVLMDDGEVKALIIDPSTGALMYASDNPDFAGFTLRTIPSVGVPPIAGLMAAFNDGGELVYHPVVSIESQVSPDGTPSLRCSVLGPDGSLLICEDSPGFLGYNYHNPYIDPADIIAHRDAAADLYNAIDAVLRGMIPAP